jgi:hypothetical protein
MKDVGLCPTGLSEVFDLAKAVRRCLTELNEAFGFVKVVELRSTVSLLTADSFVRVATHESPAPDTSPAA